MVRKLIILSANQGGLTLNRMDFAIGDPYTWYIPGSIVEEVPVRFRATLPASR